MFPSSISFLCVFIQLITIDGRKIDQMRLRGVQTSFLSMYVPSKPFMCLDGSMTIPFEYVNDDYCDCRDGSDEPGTSACPNGRFFCENKGHTGVVIPSHLVNDGVCDCCDGSDEYEGRVNCKNTCFELAQKSQAEREAQRVLHETGVTKKKEIIANAAATQTERKKRLEDLEKSIEKIQNELKEKEEAKKQAEIPETAAKEKHQQWWQDERARRESIARDRQMKEIFDDLDTNDDTFVSVDELRMHSELDNDKENDFTVEEAKTILGNDKVDLNEFNITVFDQISNSYQKIDFDATTVPTSLEHEKHLHEDQMPEYDDETKKLIEIADHTRLEYNEIHRQFTEVQNQIDDLKRQSNVDIGHQGEFAAFIDQCYDYEEREYTYRVCMFKEAKQIPKGGGTDVTIGYWDSWTGPSTNKYQQMKYSKGATCWNGPARSLTLTFQCGIEHKVIDVREPSRCEYAMLFESPSACDEAIATATFHPDHVEF